MSADTTPAPWSDAARARLEEFLRDAPAQAGLTGEAAAELSADLDQHIHEEMKRENVPVISVATLEPLLARLASTPAPAAETPAPARKPVPPTPLETIQRSKPWHRWLFLLVGVIIPAATILFELFTGACGADFFRPFATPAHALFAAVVPLANYLAWRFLRNGQSRHLPRLAALLGFALVPATWYALLLAPMTPFAFVFVFIGVALQPSLPFLAIMTLAPLMSLVARKVALGRLNRTSGLESDSTRSTVRLWRKRGVLAGLAVLLLAEGPGLATRVGLSFFRSDDEVWQQRGLTLMRTLGTERALLQACYDNTSRNAAPSTDTAGWIYNWTRGLSSFAGMDGNLTTGFTTPPEAARTAWFRVTGTAYNSVPPPRRGLSFLPETRGQAVREADDWAFDPDVGSDAVAMRIRGLDLAESRLDGHLEPDAGLGYQEWTLVFTNATALPREARCQIQLPPGGVVSKVNLWIGGEPREAAYAATAEVKAAYQKVAVAQRRDPVLVTACGPDRVMVQCFPIPPGGGKMQIRLGMTAPLDHGRLWLPQIVERNFGSARSLEHSLWMQGPAPFTCAANGAASSLQKGLQALSATLKPADFTSPRAFISCDAPPAITVWTEDPFEPAERKILIGHRDPATQPAAPLICVLDSSAALRPHYDALKAAFHATQGTWILADDDEVSTIASDFPPASTFRRGAENGPALQRALDEATRHTGSVIVWLNGPQPVPLRSSAALTQRLEKNRAPAPIIDVPLSAGSNRLVEALFKLGVIQTGPRFADPLKELPPWLASLTTERHDPAWRWETKPAGTPVDGGVKVSDQLSRYRAFLASPHQPAAEDARHQLVTAKSGAVVLETREQFTASGLTPVDPALTSSVPALPEPATATLAATAVLLFTRRRKRPLVSCQPK